MIHFFLLLHTPRVHGPSRYHFNFAKLWMLLAFLYQKDEWEYPGNFQISKFSVHP
jgi:hypothetical protein